MVPGGATESWPAVVDADPFAAVLVEPCDADPESSSTAGPLQATAIRPMMSATAPVRRRTVLSRGTPTLSHLGDDAFDRGRSRFENLRGCNAKPLLGDRRVVLLKVHRRDQIVVIESGERRRLAMNSSDHRPG